MIKETVKKNLRLPKIVQVGNHFRIQTMIKGKRYSATKSSPEECIHWFELLNKEIYHNNLCLLELIDLYKRYKMSKIKSISRAECIINTLVREHTDLVTTNIQQITPKDLAKWRDYRLNQVTVGTVLLEMSFLSCVFNYAITELYILESNPMDKVVKPSKAKPRDRRISTLEEETVIKWTKYKLGSIPDTCRKQVGWCFLFALQTAMRRGEILALTAECIHKDYVYIPTSKNGTSRYVPLNNIAKQMLEGIEPKETKLFDIRLDNFNLIWRRMREQTGIQDLHFHDTRHEAITRMVRDLNIPVEKLAKVTGHKSINTLVNTYYNPTVDELSSYFMG